MSASTRCEWTFAGVRCPEAALAEPCPDCLGRFCADHMTPPRPKSIDLHLLERIH